jgi:hypothetical protein
MFECLNEAMSSCRGLDYRENFYVAVGALDKTIDELNRSRCQGLGEILGSLSIVDTSGIADFSTRYKFPLLLNDGPT